MRSIDINCDMGESYGNFTVGNDDAVFPYITSCNIACGYHGGDPGTIQRTIESAIQFGVRIGAHPSYPDLVGFGRRKLSMSRTDLATAVKYQVSAVKGMTESSGGILSYVKPHGALYNTIAEDQEEAWVVYSAIKEIDPGLIVMGLAGSHCRDIAGNLGLRFIAEAFADRRYTEMGTLMGRNSPGAVLTNPNEATAQVISIILTEQITISADSKINIKADSICIHGDNPNAIEILKAIDKALEVNGISKARFH